MTLELWLVSIRESNAYKDDVKASRTDMINEDLPSLSQATGDYKTVMNLREYHVRGVFYRILLLCR